MKFGDQIAKTNSRITKQDLHKMFLLEVYEEKRGKWVAEEL